MDLLALGEEFDIRLGFQLFYEVSAGSCWTAPGAQPVLPERGAGGVSALPQCPVQPCPLHAVQLISIN